MRPKLSDGSSGCRTAVRLGIALGLAVWLPARGWAHGEVAGGGKQNLARIVEGKSGKYRVELMHSPSLPTAGEPANMELKVMRILPVPDPLLGPEVPVSLEPSGSVLYTGSQEVLDPHLPLHAEGEAGIYGTEYRFPDNGSLLLRFVVHTEAGEDLTVDFPVTVQTNFAAFFRFWVKLAVSLLILGLTAMQLWKVRSNGGRLQQMVRPISIGAVCWVVVIFGMDIFVLDRVLALREVKVAEAPGEAVTANEDGSYTIPAEIQKELGMALVAAKEMALEQTFSAYGAVEPRPDHVAVVQAPLWGRIEFADKPLAVGDAVKRGQELVRVILELSQLERGPMEAKQRDIKGVLQQAKERKEAAQLELERAQKLVAANPAFEQDLRWAKELFDDAKDSYDQIAKQDEGYVGIIKFRDPRKTPVLSPINGIITSVDFIPGQLNPSDEYLKLFTIVDTSEVWIRGEVFLYDAPKLRIGQQALVYPANNSDRPTTGKLRYIDDWVNPASRTVTVLLDVANPQQQLNLGAFARIQFPELRRKAIAVPEQAVVDDGTIRRVYLAVEPDRFSPVEVEVGLKQNGWWQVVSGVQPGDQVLAKGAALLGSLRQEPPLLEAGGPETSSKPQETSALVPTEPHR